MRRLFVRSLLVALCLGWAMPLARATDYSSTNFFVRDPSLGGGGTSNATSTNFQVRSFFNGIGIGRGTSATFQGDSGFEYYNDVPILTQSAYRFAGNLDGTNVDYTGAAAQDNAYTVTSTGQKFRLRLLIHVENGRMPTNDITFKLQAGLKATTCAAASFSDVVTGSGAIRYTDNATPADAAALTSNAGDPTHSGHTVVNQSYEESNNFTNNIGAIEIGQDAKWDFALVNNSGLGGQRYCFRVVKVDGTVLATYTQYPEAIIDEELTFSLDATSKNFGTISPGAAPTDVSSTLTTSTNAAGGYQVTLWASQLLTQGAFTVANWTGTNAAPSTFTGAGASAFGYTTNDSNLAGGTANRFTSAANLFAGFAGSGPGDIVADNTTSPVASDVFTVTYRLRTSSTQQSGTYNTTLIYINTATY